MEYWEEKEARAKKIKQKKNDKRIRMFDVPKKSNKSHRIAELRKWESNHE